MAPPAEEQAQASAVASNGAAALAPEQKVNGTTEYGRLMAATVQEFVTHEIASAESRILGHIDATFGKFDTRLSLVERHVEQLRLRCASPLKPFGPTNRRQASPRSGCFLPKSLHLPPKSRASATQKPGIPSNLVRHLPDHAPTTTRGSVTPSGTKAAPTPSPILSGEAAPVRPPPTQEDCCTPALSLNTSGINTSAVQAHSVVQVHVKQCLPDGSGPTPRTSKAAAVSQMATGQMQATQRCPTKRPGVPDTSTTSTTTTSKRSVAPSADRKSSTTSSRMLSSLNVSVPTVVAAATPAGIRSAAAPESSSMSGPVSVPTNQQRKPAVPRAPRRSPERTKWHAFVTALPDTDSDAHKLMRSTLFDKHALDLDGTMHLSAAGARALVAEMLQGHVVSAGMTAHHQADRGMLHPVLRPLVTRAFEQTMEGREDNRSRLQRLVKYLRLHFELRILFKHPVGAASDTERRVSLTEALPKLEQKLHLSKLHLKTDALPKEGDSVLFDDLCAWAVDVRFSTTATQFRPVARGGPGGAGEASFLASKEAVGTEGEHYLESPIVDANIPRNPLCTPELNASGTHAHRSLKSPETLGKQVLTTTPVKGGPPVDSALQEPHETSSLMMDRDSAINASSTLTPEKQNSNSNSPLLKDADFSAVKNVILQEGGKLCQDLLDRMNRVEKASAIMSVKDKVQLLEQGGGKKDACTSIPLPPLQPAVEFVFDPSASAEENGAVNVAASSEVGGQDAVGGEDGCTGGGVAVVKVGGKDTVDGEKVENVAEDNDSGDFLSLEDDMMRSKADAVAVEKAESVEKVDGELQVEKKHSAEEVMRSVIARAEERAADVREKTLKEALGLWREAVQGGDTGNENKEHEEKENLLEVREENKMESGAVEEENLDRVQVGKRRKKKKDRK